jgi:NADH-quinone oxidoreductase subunit N
MYFDEQESADAAGIEASGTMRAVMSLNGLAVLALGIVPGVLLDVVARVLP